MPRSKLRSTTVKAFTERALEASSKARLIDPVVYLPQRLRGHGKRITIDDLQISLDPALVAENVVRVQEADPLGLLIALMNGQPIPQFVVQEDGSVVIEYSVADMDRREHIAKWLAARVSLHAVKTGRPGELHHDHEAIIDNAAGEP